MKNGLARGVRQASDFLMALQLTGAAKTDSHRQPAGAPAGRGDRRRPHRHRHRDRVARLLSAAGREVPQPLRDAGRRARRGRRARPTGRRRSARSPTSSSRTPARSAPSARRPRAEGRAPHSSSCCAAGAASTIAYRRRLIDSPSYTLNHEEVAKALEEGIRFAECLTPEEVDDRRLRLRRGADGRPRPAASTTADGVRRPSRSLPARTILVAAGTQPNTVLGREDPHQRRTSTAATSRPSTSTGSR